MARDVRQLRTEAAEASAAGKHKRALAAYLELEQLESRDAQWSKRAAETYRRLGKDKDAIGAFARAADRYAQGGFLVQAIAVCKLILSIDAKNDDALRRISSMNEQIGAGPTRAIAMAESNPNLADNAAVHALRSGSGAHPAIRDVSGTGSHTSLRDTGSGSHAARMDPEPVPDEPAPPIAMPRTRTPIAPVVARTTTPQNVGPRDLAASGQTPTFPDVAGFEERSRSGSTPPPLATSRTKSKPITLPPDQPLDMISLRDEVDGSVERKENSGIYEIPIDDQPIDLVEVEAEGSGDHAQAQDWQSSDYEGTYDVVDDGGDGAPTRDSSPVIEIEDPDGELAVETEAADNSVEVEDVDELEMEDIEEIPLGEPRLVGAAAADALARTPLFAGLSREALESLVQQLTLVHLSTDEVLFREGDPGDALYVIVEGEVAVQAEGPPRVEMARLGPGAFMGEVALMTDQPRSATVTATQDSELLRIDRKTLSGVLASHGEVLAAVLRFVRHRLVDRWTRTSPLFRPFDDSVREQIASRFKFLEIDAGSKLLAAGKKPDGLYIVLAGTFAVERNGSQLATVGPGELIGETALLSGQTFKSEVVARGKSLALCLPAGDFRELIMTHPHVLEYIGEAAEQSRKLEIL
jgi:CRP-like cAMP-binding protein